MWLGHRTERPTVGTAHSASSQSSPGIRAAHTTWLTPCPGLGRHRHAFHLHPWQQASLGCATSLRNLLKWVSMIQEFPISKALLKFRYVEEANSRNIGASTWPAILARLQKLSFLSEEPKRCRPINTDIIAPSSCVGFFYWEHNAIKGRKVVIAVIVLTTAVLQNFIILKN